MELAQAVPGVVDLTHEEYVEIEGGIAFRVASFIIGGFAAGFNFGFNTLGPMLFD